MSKAMEVRKSMGGAVKKHNEGIVEGDRKKYYIRKERRMGIIWEAQRR